MRLKFVFPFLIMFNIASVSLAEDPLLSKLERRYQGLKSWQGKFTQTSYIEVLEQNLSKEGHIEVARPDRLRIEYLSEPQKVYIFNGNMLWVWQKYTKEVWQYQNPQQVISLEALSFLKGFADLSSLFNVMGDLKEPEGYLKITNPKLRKISLIPKDSDSPILRLILGVDKETLTINEALLFNASGNVTHYTFRNIALDPMIDEAVFSLPQGQEIKIIKK